MFRSKLIHDSLFDHTNSKINRIPAHALNIVLGTEFMRSMLDLVMSNRSAGARKGGFAVTQYMLDGGVSCLGLESGARFPYMRADGGFEAICFRRTKIIPQSSVALMSDPLFFNLIAMNYLDCKSGILRVDYIYFNLPENVNESVGLIKSRLLALKMIDPADPGNGSCGYLVSIDGDSLKNPFDIKNELTKVFENAVSV